MPAAIQIFEPGTLWEKIVTRTQHARACGAIQAISTRFETVREGGVDFLIRIISNLTRKFHDNPSPVSKTDSAAPNPFLPYDENLFVADISPTHVCLLNKYNVLDHHILMVTRMFQDQEALLTRNDGEALLTCLAEFEGLIFYNAGRVAGASQRHKHLQMVPLPLTGEGRHLPVEPLWRTARYDGTTGIVPGLPFVHVLSRMELAWLTSPGTGADGFLRQYLEMLQAVDVQKTDPAGTRPSSAPYNLLVTREWMFLIPRSTEYVEGISVNALGFAGALLVKDESQLNLLKTLGPMTALQRVGIP